MLHGKLLLDQATETTNQIMSLEEGVHRVQVIGPLGDAVVTIKQSLDDSDLDRFEPEPDMVFSVALDRTSNVMRGSTNIIAVIDGTPDGPIDVRVSRGSA